MTLVQATTLSFLRYLLVFWLISLFLCSYFIVCFEQSNHAGFGLILKHKWHITLPFVLCGKIEQNKAELDQTHQSPVHGLLYATWCLGHPFMPLVFFFQSCPGVSISRPLLLPLWRKIFPPKTCAACTCILLISSSMFLPGSFSLMTLLKAASTQHPAFLFRLLSFLFVCLLPWPALYTLQRSEPT